VLDAICFALYGTVPGGVTAARSRRAGAQFREARVRLVFESAGVRFVATRVVQARMQ